MEHPAELLLQLGAVLVLLALAARAANRLGLSPIPFYLLIGLVLGAGFIFPIEEAEQAFIEAGAEIGVVLLLLMLGLEYTPEELTQGLRTGWRAAAVDLVGNFPPGLVAGFILGWEVMPAVLLGGVTYISSSGIVAKLVDDLGWLGNRETPIVLSILVAEDLVMAFYLPLVGALLVGGAALTVGTSVAFALAAAGAALVIALKFGEQVSRVVFSRSNEALLLGMLGFTLVVAGGAELLHISAAVGAFFVGLALSGPAQEHAHEILPPLRDLFAGAFFVFIGLSIDVGELPAVAIPALALAVITGATKFLTASWGARSLGIAERGQNRAGAVLLARGEFSLIIAGIGMSAGVEPQLGALAAGYVLILAIAGPVVARRIGQPSSRVRGA